MLTALTPKASLKITQYRLRSKSNVHFLVVSDHYHSGFPLLSEPIGFPPLGSDVFDNNDFINANRNRNAAMSKKWDFPVRKSNREKLSTKIQGERKVSKADELRRKAEAAKAHAEALAAEAEAEAARETESKNISTEKIDKAVELLVNLEQAKAWYGELDEIIDDMIESGQDTFESSDGVVVTLVDNFATKNKCWKPAPFKRFDLQLIETKFGREK